VVSFGQGCEGEPLLQADVLKESITMMRQTTFRGTITLNTNASLPEKVRLLSLAGLDSMRVSLNSCRPGLYHAYYRPHGYTFRDVIHSIEVMKAEGGFVSINYFVLPGMTDDEEECNALCRLVAATRIDLIQMRNFNIDPEWYMASVGHKPKGKPIGVRQLIHLLKDRFPDLRIGYFNPCLDPDLQN
jgi:molybdenum cofactor biosynthesis enzyme MoaA